MKNVTVIERNKRRSLLRKYLVSTVACATVAVFMVPVLADSEAETATVTEVSGVLVPCGRTDHCVREVYPSVHRSRSYYRII